MHSAAKHRTKRLNARTLDITLLKMLLDLIIPPARNMYICYSPNKTYLFFLFRR